MRVFMYNLLPLSQFSKTVTCKMLCIVSALCISFSSYAFSFNDVVTKAEKLAKKSYVQPSKNIPNELASLQFADYQKIQLDRKSVV